MTEVIGKIGGPGVCGGLLDVTNQLLKKLWGETNNKNNI